MQLCKITLAKASTIAGTATNSGRKREAADKFILQYNRGGWATLKWLGILVAVGEFIFHIYLKRDEKVTP